MKRERLFQFIKSLLECGDAAKSSLSLGELKRILTVQNADKELIDLVDRTLSGFPEVKEAAEKHALTEQTLNEAIKRALTEQTLNEAIKRAEIRRNWEEENRLHGRC